jgi:PPOX class probable F420-dependent enzyme
LIDGRAKDIITRARVARLGTVDGNNQPYVIPVVFVFDGAYFFIPLDRKTKTVTPGDLRRVKNIEKNAKVALIIDQYSEAWEKLWFIMIMGQAGIIKKKDQVALLKEIHKMLITKYPQYRSLGMGESCIKIQPLKVTSWKNAMGTVQH